MFYRSQQLTLNSTERSTANFDRPDRICLDFLPPLEAADARKAGGYGKLSHMPSVISSLVDWHLFFITIFESADQVMRTRLLTHSGHGGVASLTSDTTCIHSASTPDVSVRVILGGGISGSKSLIDGSLLCPFS